MVHLSLRFSYVHFLGCASEQEKERMETTRRETPEGGEEKTKTEGCASAPRGRRRAGLPRARRRRCSPWLRRGESSVPRRPGGRPRPSRTLGVKELRAVVCTVLAFKSYRVFVDYRSIFIGVGSFSYSSYSFFVFWMYLVWEVVSFGNFYS